MKQKQASSSIFTFILLLFLVNIGFGQDTITTYFEDFEEEVSLDLWRPNTIEHEDGTPAFDVYQEDGILNIAVNQVNFYDGMFFNFTEHENIIFDITNVPYVSIDVKIEPGATYGGIEVDSVALTISVWGESEDESLQKEFESVVNYAPDDGEWHTLIYEIIPVCWITIPCNYEENYAEIEAILFGSIIFPDTYVYDMQMDNFKIGEIATPLVTTRAPTKKIITTIVPNPVTANLLIQAEEKIEMIKIFDLQGRLMASHNVDQLKTISIDFSSYAKGFYLVETRSATKISTSKVLKQ